MYTEASSLKKKQKKKTKKKNMLSLSLWVLLRWSEGRGGKFIRFIFLFKEKAHKDVQKLFYFDKLLE